MRTFIIIVVLALLVLGLTLYFMGKSDYVIGDRTLTFEEKIVVTHKNDGEYIIKFEEPSNYTIYAGDSPETVNWDKSVHEIVNSDEAVIENSENKTRLFFGITDADSKDTAVVSERLIPMQGTTNFRDIGGIATTDDRYTQWGKIYRSDRLAGLTDADLQRFRQLGIFQVIDFRNDIEISKNPDRLPDDFQGEYLQVPIVDKEGVAYQEMRRRIFLGGERRDKAKELFTTVMAEFSDSSAVDFKPLFDKLLQTDKPLLYHCTGGKDRTGYATAMILSALGVDKETIIAEYLMSNYYRYDKALSSIAKFRYAGLDKETTANLFMVQQEYIEKVFEIVENDFGGIDNYLEEKFDLTPEKRALLREKYTYPAATYMPEKEDTAER